MRRYSRVFLLIIAILIILSATFILWRPLKEAVKTLVFPEGITIVAEEKAETWGPIDRETFTWENRSSYATFNSITDNPSLVHESNFVRVREAGQGNFSDNVNIEAGKEYEVFIYYHNNGDYNLNPDVMAYNTRIKVDFPNELHDNQAGVIKCSVIWTNDAATETSEVWDTAFLHSKADLTLKYVPNSAVLHNGSSGIYSTTGAILDSKSLFGPGARIAYDSRYWGIIPGGDDYAGYVIFKIVVEEQ